MGRLYVPEGVQSQVLQWGHSSKKSCHPGVHIMLDFLRQLFWWPTIARDTRSFVLACSTCAHGKSSHVSPRGLLQPLGTPSHPWSHIAVDFVTGLSLSEGNTTILTVIDQFSKAVHFVLLPKLPLASETAHLWCSMDSDYTGFPRTLCQTEVRSFHHKYGDPFARPWEHRPVCVTATTLSQMDRRNGRTRTWGPPFGV